MAAVIRNEVRRISEEVAEFCRISAPDSQPKLYSKRGEK